MPVQQESSAYCNECRRNVLARRTAPNHLIHFLLTFFTCVWGFVWVYVTLFGYGPWRCTRCGSTDL